MTFNRMRWRASSGSSLRRNSRSSPMRVATSPSGLPQFSTENAYSVRKGIPSSRAHSTTARTARIPMRCPSTRGSPRSFAHRPFPSMMTATWRGSAAASVPPLCMGPRSLVPGSVLALDDRSGGAGFDAGEALRAGVVHLVLFALLDGCGGAGVQAGPAGGAFLGDTDGHGSFLLLDAAVDETEGPKEPFRPPGSPVPWLSGCRRFS